MNKSRSGEGVPKQKEELRESKELKRERTERGAEGYGVGGNKGPERGTPPRTYLAAVWLWEPSWLAEAESLARLPSLTASPE